MQTPAEALGSLKNAKLVNGGLAWFATHYLVIGLSHTSSSAGVMSVALDYFEPSQSVEKFRSLSTKQTWVDFVLAKLRGSDAGLPGLNMEPFAFGQAFKIFRGDSSNVGRTAIKFSTYWLPISSRPTGAEVQGAGWMQRALAAGTCDCYRAASLSRSSVRRSMTGLAFCTPTSADPKTRQPRPLRIDCGGAFDAKTGTSKGCMKLPRTLAAGQPDFFITETFTGCTVMIAEESNGDLILAHVQPPDSDVVLPQGKRASNVLHDAAALNGATLNGLSCPLTYGANDYFRVQLNM